MSHASVLVVLNPEEVERHGGIKEAVAHQMQPFDEDEKGGWFSDGSRWDWYVIGGRFEGKFDGKDVIQVKELDLEKIQEKRKVQLTRQYEAAKEEQHRGARHLIYDVDPDETTLEEFLGKFLDGLKFPPAYAFLRARHWHEGERLGWFGATAATECEIKARDNPDVETMIRRCKHKDPETGASIVVWNEPYEVWGKKFYERFIEPLPEDAWLVNVDYHV